MSVSSTIPRRARINILGDSVTSGNGNLGGAVCWQGPLPALLDSRFQSNGAASGAPVYFIRGVAGNTIADITARVAADCTGFKPSLVIVQAGTNDGTIGRSQAQANTDTLALIDAIVAGNPTASLVVMGPIMVGDKWPTGQESFDTGLDNVNAGMLQACTTRGVKFINIRAYWYTQAPTLNPTNIHGASGLMTFNGSDGSVKHPTALGATFMSNYFNSQI